MSECSTIEKAKKIIIAYLDETLPADLSNRIVSVAYEYIGLVCALCDPTLSGHGLSACVALCRDAEQRVRALYASYVRQATDDD